MFLAVVVVDDDDDCDADNDETRRLVALPWVENPVKPRDAAALNAEKPEMAAVEDAITVRVTMNEAAK